MHIEIIDWEDVPKGTHPLHASPQYAANLAGGSLFFQVMSGLTENPVKIILHDRFSGKRKVLIVETARELSPLLKSEDPKVQAEVRKVSLPREAPPAAVVKPAPKVISTPQVAPKAPPAPKLVPSGGAPAPKLVPSGGAPAPKSLDTPKVASGGSLLKPPAKLTVPPLKPSPSLKK